VRGRARRTRGRRAARALVRRGDGAAGIGRRRGGPSGIIALYIFIYIASLAVVLSAVSIIIFICILLCLLILFTWLGEATAQLATVDAVVVLAVLLHYIY